MVDDECLVKRFRQNSQQTNHSRSSLPLTRVLVDETLLVVQLLDFEEVDTNVVSVSLISRFAKMDIPAVVQTIEYDPHRSAFIALVKDADGEHRYVLAHSTMKVGDTIITSANAKPCRWKSSQNR
jgi:hypothetical protein